MSKTNNANIKSVTIDEMLAASGNGNPLVEIRNMDVTFGYGQAGFKAVNQMNLNIFEGEVLGLVGESGSGKSTTGNAISGIVDHSGSIKVSDFDIPTSTKAIKGEIKKKMVSNIQMIFQDPAASLNPFKNIEKVVSEGLNNVDSRPLFMKSFDGKTINELLKIVDAHSTRGFLSHLSHKTLHEWVENKEYDKIKHEVYEKAIVELKNIDKPWAKTAVTYLEARLFERNKYFEGKASKKLIAKKMVIETLKSVGLSERVLNRFPLEFSGGQQQRIGISRAIILNPRLLIADEPISALDVSIQAQVINILNTLKESLNLTILFIAHDLRMVEYISDRIAVMYKGVVVEVGESSELAANPTHPYTKMLMDAVPSIDGKKGSLIGYMYDPRIHDYSTDKPTWKQIGNKNHFVLGTDNEVAEWVQKKWAVIPEESVVKSEVTIEGKKEKPKKFSKFTKQDPKTEIVVQEQSTELAEIKKEKSPKKEVTKSSDVVVKNSTKSKKSTGQLKVKEVKETKKENAESGVDVLKSLARPTPKKGGKK